MEIKTITMENMGVNDMVNSSFWKDKRVFLTGHTGFKGSWLSIWLTSMGAEVTGFSLTPLTNPSLFTLAGVEKLMSSIIGDIRDVNLLERAIIEANPDIVIHMAAQPLVKESYENPVDTYSTNVMGTVNLLESVRHCQTVKAVVNVTTDKVYENKEWVWGYRETDRLGGYDPYSNSKACSELVTSSYVNSFFNPEKYVEHGVAIATARAGNVIGGGDWADNRLVPDCLRSLLREEIITIRNPHAIRPWQHVLEPLHGYLLLAEKLYMEGPKYAEAWNFAANDEDSKPVEWIVQKMINYWGGETTYQLDNIEHPHEAGFLKLDCSKAKVILGWQSKWSLEVAIQKIVEWHKAYELGQNMLDMCVGQITSYMDEKEFI